MFITIAESENFQNLGNISDASAGVELENGAGNIHTDENEQNVADENSNVSLEGNVNTYQ